MTTDGVRVVRDNGAECTVPTGNRISFGDNFWYYVDYNSEGLRAIKVVTDSENILNGCNGWTVDNGILKRSVEIDKP